VLPVSVGLFLTAVIAPSRLSVPAETRAGPGFLVTCVVPPGKPVFGFVSHREKKSQKLRESDCEGVRQEGGHERRWSGRNNQSGETEQPEYSRNCQLRRFSRTNASR
jgi:hypothetical protein